MNRVLIKKLFYHFSKPFPFKLLQRLSNQNFIFPFYHLVTDAPSPLVKNLYPVRDVKQFIKDLDFLQDHFAPASFEEVLNLAGGKAHAGRPKFFLTFDDGFSECYEVIFPILKERMLPAIFFINPAFVGNRQLSHRQKVSLIIEHVLNDEIPIDTGERIGKKFQCKAEFIHYIKKLTAADSATIDKIAAILKIDFSLALQQHKPYMDVPQLRELKNSGFIIGSHSYDHPEFNMISEEEMKVQVNRSFWFLDEELGVNDRIFSFPFHDVGVPLSFFNFLRNEANVKASFGTSGIKYDNASGHIHRIPMEVDGHKGAESIIRSEYFYYIGKAVAGKNLVKRR